MKAHVHEWVFESDAFMVRTWACRRCGRWKRRWRDYRGEPTGKAWYSR